ncbi:hypothetical protein LAZ67_11002234 [Cordylochernes scorpioides]|uniref:Helix-turn-helix domain-containing protein n=1 Tax=Cordylochernes scorpioides TaxID=51811 RepID=A0ABY6KZ25_9ARAC|nr:hypothetical protein LAZ67_11002234 [Cordylochernes scorpioides]
MNVGAWGLQGRYSAGKPYLVDQWANFERWRVLQLPSWRLTSAVVSVRNEVMTGWGRRVATMAMMLLMVLERLRICEKHPWVLDFSNCFWALSDILIIRTPSHYHTTVYHKINNPTFYTNFKSFCPLSHRINTVRTLTKRLVTHCSLPIFRSLEFSNIKKQLALSQYPHHFIHKYQYNPAHMKPMLPHRNTCILPYSTQSAAISHLLKSYGINTFFKNNKSLATILRHPITRLQRPASVQSSGGSVYSVSCNDCGATYIGETGMSVAIRMVEHGRHSDGNGSTCLANVCGRALLTRDRVDRANRMEGIWGGIRFSVWVTEGCEQGCKYSALLSISAYAKIPFLDILIIRTASTFHTTVYYKKQCPPSYTHFNSHCPISHKINIIRTLTKRIFTHCSLDIFKETARNLIISHLSKASFQLEFISRYSYTPGPSNLPIIYRSLCFLPYSPSSVDIARSLKTYGIRIIYKNSSNLLTPLRHPYTKSYAPPQIPSILLARSTLSRVSNALPHTLARQVDPLPSECLNILETSPIMTPGHSFISTLSILAILLTPTTPLYIIETFITSTND